MRAAGGAAASVPGALWRNNLIVLQPTPVQLPRPTETEVLRLGSRPIWMPHTYTVGSTRDTVLKSVQLLQLHLRDKLKRNTEKILTASRQGQRPVW